MKIFKYTYIFVSNLQLAIVLFKIIIRICPHFFFCNEGNNELIKLIENWFIPYLTLEIILN